MATYLRVQDGVAVEEWSEPEGFSIDDCFTPEVVATFQPKGSAKVGWTWNGSKFSAPVTAPVTTDDLIAYAAAKRFSIETGGYIYDGHPISTDRNSQSMITSVAVAANSVGSTFSTKWKCSDGTFFTLDQATAIAMATGVMNFVSACFAIEASVASAISGGAIKALSDIDAASWPTNS